MAEVGKYKTGRGEVGGWRKIAPFAILSLFGFLIGAGLLCLMLWKSELFVSLGLVGNLYYIALLFLALVPSLLLFGLLRSYARYKGKLLGGTLELAGPCVLYALVVIGGFYLPKPSPESFSVTVLVHGEAGPHDFVLRNSGTVWMTLGTDPRQEKIGDKGQADFKNVPAGFRGQSVPISVEADGFEMAEPDKKYLLGGDGVSVTVRRKAVRFSGIVLGTEGRPVTNATVQAGEARAAVDSTGHFTLTLKQADGSTEIKGEVTAPGFELWRGRFVPNAGDATVQLHRNP